jgi:lactate 2-monooxygenase
MSYAELERRAELALPPSIVSSVAGGAGDEATQRANVEAFGRWGLAPRMFVGAKERDLSVELFGIRWPAPLFMSPVGVIGICAQDGHGDLAAARAAARTGVPMITSTLMADPLEEAVPEFGNTPGFFQLYTPNDRDLAASPSNAPRRPGSKASSLPSTPGLPAGGRVTCPPRTFLSCAVSAWRTTSPTPCSVPG